jgi:short-subunit dehydrogenase
MKKTERKRVWITGASSGIGEALAYEFSKNNAELILSGRNENKLKEVKQKCAQHKVSVTIIPFDLSDLESIKNAANTVINKIGGLDLLINNGGISQRELASKTDLEVDKKIMSINYFGNIALTKAVLPSMLENGGGHIAVTTSIVGKFGFPLRSAYSASKHALYGFYDTLRAELEDKNIKVTMICPGRIRTNISLHALDGHGEEHGKLDYGQKHGISSEKAAKKIVRALNKNKKEVLVGGSELLMVHLKRFLPFVFHQITRRIKPT